MFKTVNIIPKRARAHLLERWTRATTSGYREGIEPFTPQELVWFRYRYKNVPEPLQFKPGTIIEIMREGRLVAAYSVQWSDGNRYGARIIRVG